MEQHNAPCCPLRNGARCILERCAWWNPIGEECSIVTITKITAFKLEEAEE